MPTRQILDTFKPDAIIAEGALGLTSTWELGARRAFGGPLLLFWTIGYDPNRPRDRGNMALRQWPYVLAYAPADALVLYGHDGADFLRRFYAQQADVRGAEHHRRGSAAAPSRPDHRRQQRSAGLSC